MKPVFILGPPRSGTSLLLEILGTHPQISAQTSSFNRFHHDLQLFKGVAEYPEHYRLTSADFTPSLKSKYQLAIQNILNAEQTNLFVLKISTLSQQVDFIRRLFPQARFIQLVRDARDSVCSMEGLRQSLQTQLQRPRLLGPAADPLGLWAARNIKQPFLNAAASWFYHITRSWMDLCWTSPKDFLRIRFESLLCEPAHTIEQVAEFLDIQFAAPLHQHLKLIQNNPRPIDTLGFSITQAPGSKIGRYHNELPNTIRKAIAPLVELPMQLLGYEADIPLCDEELLQIGDELSIDGNQWLEKIRQEVDYFKVQKDAFAPHRLFRQSSTPTPTQKPLLRDTVFLQTQTREMDGLNWNSTSTITKQDRHYEFPDTNSDWPQLARLLDGKHTIAQLQRKYSSIDNLLQLITQLHQRGFLAYIE